MRLGLHALPAAATAWHETQQDQYFGAYKYIFKYISRFKKLTFCFSFQRFLALYGEFEVELDNGSAEMQRCILKTGDLVEIKMGNYYL